MLKMPISRIVCGCLSIAAALAIVAMAPTPALAQPQVVVVNGDPITAFDIDQRIRLTQLSTNKAPTRQAVIQELIDEKLKIQLARRYTIDSMDTDVNNTFNNMARRMRKTPQQFTEELGKNGVQAGTLKSRIRAEITWSQVIRGRYASSLQIGERDIQQKLDERSGSDKAVGYDYTLRPILFVVPKASPPSLVDTRRREAEALRGRFQGCDDGITLARSMRDVAVRATVVRSSADLPPALRDLLEKTEIGKLTAPEVTAQGVEVYALCGKKQSASDNTPGKREVRDELFQAQFNTHAERFLKELRSQAMIEYK